ncbi:putative dispersed gene family protein 1 (DGF-1) [Trypanosoma cruzi]|nr:putative dispersed gene family protein 1 (DGF-1) [Trypanosoma cruzi]
MVVVWDCAGGGRAMLSLAWWRLRFFVSVVVLWWGLFLAGCLCVPLCLFAVVAVFISFLTEQIEILWIDLHNYRFKVLRITCSIRTSSIGITIYRNCFSGFSICRKGFAKRDF